MQKNIIPNNTDLLDENDEIIYKKLLSSNARNLYLYTSDGASLSLENFYRGRHAFLVLSGPSLKSHNLDFLTQRGVVTMGVNNSWSVFKPNLWVSVDDPGNFLDIGWKDASIFKFVPMGHAFKYLQVKEEDNKFRQSQFRVNEMPSVFYFKRNEKFTVSSFLTEPSINWGNPDKEKDELGNKGGRSVMLAAIRLLYYLGFRRVYLLGADFNMKSDNEHYAFQQSRTPHSINGNNKTYKTLNSRFAALKPIFDELNFKVYNCYKDSGLNVFKYMPFEEAVEKATRECKKIIDTEGWYDRKDREKKEQQEIQKKQAEQLAIRDYGEEVEESSDS